MNAKTLLQQLTVFDSSEDCLLMLNRLTQPEQGYTTVGFLNQHGFNLMQKDPSSLVSFQQLDLLLRDGIGISLAMKYVGMQQGANLNGTDLIPKIVQQYKQPDTDCYVLGTQSPWLEQGSQQLLGDSPKAVAEGFEPINFYLDFLKKRINPARFNLIILAMGMPKQEAVAARIKQELNGRGLVVCGGAIIDFQAGRFKRAPAWIQKWSLEWLYRLVKEPKRLFKRYVIGIPVFLFSVVFRS